MSAVRERRVRDTAARMAARTVGPAIHRIPRFEAWLLNWNVTLNAPGFPRPSVIDLLFRVHYRYWIDAVYLTEPDPDARERLKALAMGSASGARWARRYQAQEIRLDAVANDCVLPLRDIVPVYTELPAYLEAADEATVVQIGSSSGREIALFADEFPRHTFVGVDPYPDVVEVSRSLARKNSTFIVGSAQTIDTDLRDLERESGIGLEHVVCFSHGSLQYVQPEHMATFFAHCRGLGVRRIYVSEPVSVQAGPVEALERSWWQGSFTYTHPYHRLGESAGYATRGFRVMNPFLPNLPARRRSPHDRVCYWVGELAKETS